jgi:hypothetical protein
MNATDRVITDLLKENQQLHDTIDRLEEELAEARQTIEDIAIGVALECPKCKCYKPCDCDHGG